MATILEKSFILIYFILRWTGLTSWSFQKNQTKPTIYQKFIFIIFLILIWYCGNSTYECQFETKDLGFGKINISQFFSSFYICLLLLIIKLKQKSIANICIQLVDFEKAANKVLSTEIGDIMTKSSILQIYASIQFVTWTAYFIMIFSLVSNFSLKSLFCFLKSLILFAAANMVEGFLFYLMSVFTHILNEFGKVLSKETKPLPKNVINGIKEIFHDFFNLKNKFQNVYKIIFFIKFNYLSSSLGSSIYATVLAYQKTKNVWCSWKMLVKFIIFGNLVLSSLIQLIFLIYPFATFYKTVKVMPFQQNRLYTVFFIDNINIRPY